MDFLCWGQNLLGQIQPSKWALLHCIKISHKFCSVFWGQLFVGSNFNLIGKKNEWFVMCRSGDRRHTHICIYTYIIICITLFCNFPHRFPMDRSIQWKLIGKTQSMEQEMVSMARLWTSSSSFSPYLLGFLLHKTQCSETLLLLLLVFPPPPLPIILHLWTP